MKKNLFLTLSLGLIMPIFLTASSDIRQNYIATYKRIAMDEMERVGVPASIKMAQALLESGAGTSTLALQANNHFGIKCGKNWNGKTMYRKDDDYDDKGKLIASCFRKYESVSSSFRAHSQFLLDNRRYAFLFELDPTDYKGWARGLKKAGYATSSTYANKLIQLIEEYELYLFDLGIDNTEESIVATEPEVVKEQPKPVAVKHTPRPNAPRANSVLAVITINDVKNVSARVGDTPERIANQTNVDVRKLIRWNEFLNRPNQSLNGGERIYLQPKRKSYRGKKKYHFVKAGESMFDISQLYGIRLKTLYEKNRLDPGYEPASGQRIKIRGAKVKENEIPRKNWKENRSPITVDNFEWEDENEEETDRENYLDAVVSQKNNSNKSSSKPEDIVWERPTASVPTVTKPIAKPSKEETIIWDAPKQNVEEKTHLTDSHFKQYKVEGEKMVEIKPEAKSKAKPETNPVGTYSPPAPRVHVVSRSETLYGISKNYGLSVADLKAKNDLRSNTISIGQRLIID